jgi:hypothetical protein
MADIYVATTGSDSTGTGTSGNPYATPGKAGAVHAGGDRILIKAGTYNISVNTSNVAGGYLTPAAGSAGAPTRVVGYNATVGDLDAINDFSNFPILQQSTAAITHIINSAGNYTWVRNLVLDGKSNTNYGVDNNGRYNAFSNLKATGFTTYGLYSGQINCRFLRCYVTGNATGIFLFNNDISVYGCTITANTAKGIDCQGNGLIVRCLIHGNTGASTDGISFAGGGNGVAIGCSIAGNGRDGIRVDDGSVAALIQGNILGGNGGYNLNASASDWSALSEVSQIDRNFLYASTSGHYHNLPAGPNDVSLTGNPFTASASGDFSLNSTAGAGAAVRAAGWPGVFPGGLTTGYLDGGAAQHQDAGGGPSGPTYFAY